MRDLFEKIKFSIKAMIWDIRGIYDEKGFEPFKRPLLYATPVILILYFIIYSPTIDKLEKKNREFRNIDAIDEYYDDYTNIKLRVKGFRRALPAFKDKDDWLNYILSSTAKTHDITFNSVSSQKEMALSGYVVVSMDVSFSSTYDKIGRWISNMENSPIFLRLTDFTMVKDSTNIGKVKVTLTLSTVFAKFPV